MLEQGRKIAVLAGALILAGASSAQESTKQTDQAAKSSKTSQPSGAPGSKQSGQAASSGSASQQQKQSAEYIDHQVLDRKGEKVGTVEEVWEDQQGRPVYLTVKRANNNDLIIIPAEMSQISQQREAIKIPYAKETIMSAPKFTVQDKLDEKSEQQIVAFYASREPQVSQQQQQSRARRQQQSQQQVASASGDRQQQDEATIRLKEEQLKVGKRQVEAGGVLLRKVVRTETVNRPVTLRREELVVERQPGSGKPIEGNAQFGEREIFIPLFREEPVVQKDVVLKEVVNVGKNAEQQKRDVTAELREEELEIRRQGEARQNAGGTAAGQSGQGSAQQKQEQNSKSSESKTQPKQ